MEEKFNGQDDSAPGARQRPEGHTSVSAFEDIVKALGPDILPQEPAEDESPLAGGTPGVAPGVSIDAEKLKEEIAATNNKYLRLYADFDNYRKRVAREKEDMVKYGCESLVAGLLPVMDNLEMALSHVAEPSQDPLAQGVDMTLKEMKKALGRFGVVEIDAKGKPFDPQYQEAMVEVEREDVPERTVVEEFRRGYMLNDRVIRASLVSVSKKPANRQA